MRITAPLLVLLCGCRTWTEPPPIGEPPVLDDDDATDLLAGSWTPQLLADIARNPDVGWVAANPNSGWSDLVARAGGQDPFRAASVIYTRLPVADWLAPADGSDNAAAGTGSAANQLSSAIDRGRYVGLRIVAEAADDLPSGWPTTTDPPGVVPDAAVSLVDDHGVLRPDYTDPDFRNFMFEVIVALGDRFGAASGPGLAFVDLGGIGDEGAFYFDDPSAWFEGDPPRYDDNAWTGTVDLWADTYRGAFGDDIPIFANWRVLQHAGSRLPEMRLALPALSVEEVRTWARRRAPEGVDLDEAWVAGVHERTGGLPVGVAHNLGRLDRAGWDPAGAPPVPGASERFEELADRWGDPGRALALDVLAVLHPAGPVALDLLAGGLGTPDGRAVRKREMKRLLEPVSDQIEGWPEDVRLREAGLAEHVRTRVLSRDELRERVAQVAQRLAGDPDAGPRLRGGFLARWYDAAREPDAGARAAAATLLHRLRDEERWDELYQAAATIGPRSASWPSQLPAPTIECLSAAAGGGHPEAQALLAMAIAWGMGVPGDLGSAAALAQRAEAAGSAQAMLFLSQSHLLGIGVPGDIGEGVLWALRAATRAASEGEADTSFLRRQALWTLVLAGEADLWERWLGLTFHDPRQESYRDCAWPAVSILLLAHRGVPSDVLAALLRVLGAAADCGNDLARDSRQQLLVFHESESHAKDAPPGSSPETWWQSRRDGLRARALRGETAAMILLSSLLRVLSEETGGAEVETANDWLREAARKGDLVAITDLALSGARPGEDAAATRRRRAHWQAELRKTRYLELLEDLGRRVHASEELRSLVAPVIEEEADRELRARLYLLLAQRGEAAQGEDAEQARKEAENLQASCDEPTHLRIEQLRAPRRDPEGHATLAAVVPPPEERNTSEEPAVEVPAPGDGQVAAAPTAGEED